jgi:hypothetical protein
MATTNGVGKRKRGGPMTAAQRRAMFAQMKFSKAQPWADYGAARIKRGSPYSRQTFGKTWREANAEQKANRKFSGYTGRGSYFGKGLNILKGAGKALGLSAGRDTPLGRMYAGAMDVDKLVDAGIDLYSGRGSYAPKMAANNLVVGAPDTQPRMTTVPDEVGALVITHRERVADVIAPSTDGFSLQTYTINPGLESFAPWLHQLASCYEEYQVVQCVYEYQGHQIVGLQSGLELGGQVIAATQYNTKLPAFRDRHEMMAYPHASNCSFSGKMVHGVEADPSKIAGDGHKLIRAGGLLDADDARDFDHGKFSLALNNTPSDLYNKEVGQLFVYYTIKLMKPKISAGRGSAISTYLQICQNGHVNSPFGVSGQSNNEGPLVASRNTLDMKYLGSVAGAGSKRASSWEFPAYAAGMYKVSMLLRGTNLDSGGSEFSDLVTSGEVSLANKFYPSFAHNPFPRNFRADEDGGASARCEFIVIVRPQIGNVKNRFTISTDLHTDDTINETCVEVTEINTLGEDGAGLPEFKSLATGKIPSFDL